MKITSMLELSNYWDVDIDDRVTFSTYGTIGLLEFFNNKLYI